jgi:DNA helicase-2/ATP-dependent DNA helicase PcrA
MKYLSDLNEAQKKAVLETEGPVLVLAGAGAGKTRTIAHRIVHIVNSGVNPASILAITFTNKAAREMRERVYELLHKHAPSHGGSGTVTVSTFHALCVILLRAHAQDADIPKHFTIYDRADSLRAIKKALKQAGESDSQVEPRAVLSAISRAKGDAKTLATYREETGNAYFPLLVASVWEHYEKILRKDGALDFDDLLLRMWVLLSTKDDIRSALSNRYVYIHVDEYQDTNKVQYEITRMLTGDDNNIFCVGDLDQNIYSWRGSTIENILEFEKTYRDAKIYRLEENYRSTQNIIAVSNDIIKKNVRRKEKVLFTNNPEGEKLSLILGYNEHDEASRIVESVASRLEDGVSPEEIALLYRANFQSRVLEEAFLVAGIPYKVLGTRFFDRKEIKDMLSYVKVALHRESELELTRTINTPLRGIGKVTVSKLLSEGKDALTGSARAKVDAYFSIIDGIGECAVNAKASEVLTYTLKHSGIEASLTGKGEEELERLENIKELVSLATSRYDAYPAPEGLLRLIEDAALATDQDELDTKTNRDQTPSVTLMTIHASKGLEFKHIYITGLEDGLFPQERTESTFGGQVDDEEERRLFYVALTRARETVTLSYAQMRTVFGQQLPRIPSEFLLDIDEAYLAHDSGGRGVGSAQREKIVYLD